MKHSAGKLTSTELMVAASQVLVAGGYQRVTRSFPDWDTPTSRLFEDEYNVVGIAVFDTCAELLRVWSDLQGALANVISSHIGRGESKSWDGYLVLLTPAAVPSEEAGLDAVRYDTTRLRKIVATGSDLHTATDIERVLRPLLPLAAERVLPSGGSTLELLPDLLAEHGIPRKTTEVLLDAFRQQAPLLERLHDEAG